MGRKQAGLPRPLPEADGPHNNAEKMRADGMPVGVPFGPDNPPPGRPKGSRHKLSEDFIKALAEDFEAHGAAAIVKMREDRPADYIKVIASLMPKDLNLNVNKYDHMTDEQLVDRLEELDAELEPYMRSIGRRRRRPI